MSEFTDFATGIGRGLARAYTEDIDVFLIFNAGILLGAPSRPLRGLGTALALYTVLRRADQYVDAMRSTAASLVLNKALTNNIIYSQEPPTQ